MSGEDYDLLHKAAASLWPQAIISNSGILLGLAKDRCHQRPRPKEAGLVVTADLEIPTCVVRWLFLFPTSSSPQLAAGMWRDASVTAVFQGAG
jgi:hypothetical protein